MLFSKNKLLSLIISITTILFLLFTLGYCTSNKQNENKFTASQKYNVSKHFETLSGQIKIDIHLSKEKISVIENLYVLVEIRKSQNINIIFPKEEDISTTYFTISGVSELTTGKEEDEEDIEILKKSFVLRPEVIGEGSINYIKIKYFIKSEMKSSNQTDIPVFKTDKIVIPIISYTGKDKDKVPFLDKLKPEPLESDYTYLIVGLIVIGCAIIISTIVLLIRKLMINKKPKKEDVEIIPAYKIALQLFKELEKENLITKGRVALYHRKLSLILREFIENQFNIHAPEQTTEEFMGEMYKFNNINQEQKDLLKEFLIQCDLIKFAKHIPPLSYHDKALNIARDFVISSIKNMNKETENSENLLVNKSISK